MRSKIIYFLCAIMLCNALKAEQFGEFVEYIYDEMNGLGLSPKQEIALRNAIKDHHHFLKRWYSNARANNVRLMRHFADSTLHSEAPEFAQDRTLSSDKILAEHRFMMSVYEILDANQRRIFSTKINQQVESKKGKNEAHKGVFMKFKK